jgi:hypothetical protein
MKKCTTYILGKTIISSEYDDTPMDDIYGKYGNTLKPGCIIRYEKEFYEDIIDKEDYEIPLLNNGECSFFYPADNGEKIGTDEYKKYALLNYQRMEDYNNNHWSYLIIRCETFVHTDSGLSDGVFDTLSSVESDGEKEYLKEIIDELKNNVKYQLKNMGFSEDEINQSVDNPETKKGEMYL